MSNTIQSGLRKWPCKYKRQIYEKESTFLFKWLLTRLDIIPDYGTYNDSAINLNANIFFTYYSYYDYVLYFQTYVAECVTYLLKNVISRTLACGIVSLFFMNTTNQQVSCVLHSRDNASLMSFGILVVPFSLIRQRSEKKIKSCCNPKAILQYINIAAVYYKM